MRLATGWGLGRKASLPPLPGVGFCRTERHSCPTPVEKPGALSRAQLAAAASFWKTPRLVRPVPMLPLTGVSLHHSLS